MLSNFLASFRSSSLVQHIVAGVAGAGVFGGYHAAKYAGLEGVELGGVFDIDADRAAALARRLEGRAYGGLAAFLDKVDVLTVATPASEHFPIARRALERGRHVLIEKPIATTLEQADELIGLAESQGVVLQAGHQERFVFEAFGVLSRPKPPLSVRSVRANPPTGRGADVSVALDLMIHDIDLVRQLGLGAPVSVAATGDDDAIEAEIRCENGAIVALEASRCASVCDRRMRLVYDDGIIEIDFVKRTIDNTTSTPLETSFENAASNPVLNDPLGYGVSRFIDAVRGFAPPAISGPEARAALEWALMIDAARESEARANLSLETASVRAGGMSA